MVDVKLPVYLRVGDGDAHLIGEIGAPAEMDPLLRAAAAQVKQELRQHADRQEPARERPEKPGERQQPGAPRDRQVRKPEENR